MKRLICVCLILSCSLPFYEGNRPLIAQQSVVEKASDLPVKVIEEGVLLQVFPEKVRADQFFIARIRPGVMYRVQPKPKLLLTSTDDVTGDKILTMAAEEDTTIIIETSEVRIPIKELSAMPSFENQQSLNKWLKSYEVPLHDSRTVFVEGSPRPPPEPDPDDGDDEELSVLAKQVKELALAAVKDKAEIKKVSENYASIVSAIAAGAYGALEFPADAGKALADIYDLNTPITSKNVEWKGFIDPMRELLNKRDWKSINEVKIVLEEIQLGLEAASK